MRMHDPKTLPILATDVDPLRLGINGADVIKSLLALGYLTPDTLEYNQNYWRGMSLGDELCEPNTGLVVSIRSRATKVKQPVVLSPHTTRIFTTTGAVQFGQLVAIAADGTIQTAAAPGDRCIGAAMMDAGVGQRCWVCTSGLWYIQVNEAAVIDARADLTSDGVGRAVEGVATDTVCATMMLLPNYVVAGRNCRIAQIYTPFVLA